MAGRGWIGVDLDGTLAYHTNETWKGVDHVGEPIPAMIERVKKWLKEGKDVRIFTARVDGGDEAVAAGEEGGEHFRDIQRVKKAIETWCVKNIGQVLPITNKKDYSMIELWDDRAVQIIPNTGRRADGKN